MIPPGLAFLAVSQKAWAAHEQVNNPGYYFNFKKYQKAQADFTTPYTPATHLILALDTALEMMQAETLPGIWTRHRAMQTLLREGVTALGLRVVVPEAGDASLAVTSVFPPEGVSVDAIRSGLKNRFGITVADGQKDLKGKIFRIGHLGYVHERDVQMVLAALKAVLKDLGHDGK